MNLYRLKYRERGLTPLLDTYNILAEDLEASIVIGNKRAAKCSPGMEVECAGAEEIARDVIVEAKAKSRNA